MNCQEFADFIMAYLDGELAAEQRRVFEGHIDGCPECQSYLRSYEETVRLGRLCAEPEGPLPEDVPDELVRAILAARAEEE